MSNYVSVIFCKNCNSRYVEVTEWPEENTVEIYCRSCQARDRLSHFTLGRCRVTNTELQNARDTRASKGKQQKTK
ncbi:MAG: hypothetical protein KBA61_04085 [Spirochaetes bacterium]|nr:hypothetical protein [Spirochaetota bacterium]